MTEFTRYLDLVRNALGVSLVLAVGLAALSILSGSGIVLLIDLLFVSSVGLFAIAVVLTRPSVLRRRKIRRAERTLENETNGGSDRDERTAPSTDAPRSGGQLFWGIVCILAATFLFFLMLFLQYGWNG